MDSFKKLFDDWTDSTSESNITCNVLVIRNNTLVVLDRGWEGIPESIVLNLTICLIFIVIFVIIRGLARSRQKRQNSRQNCSESQTPVTNSTDSWLQFIYGDRTHDSINCHQNGKTCAPIPYHSHPLNNSNLIFAPNLPQISSANRLNDRTVEPIDDYDIGEDLPNDPIPIQFSRGSHQNLVELGKDEPLNSNGVMNGNGNTNTDQNSLIQTVISCSTESIRKYSHWVFDFIFIKDEQILRLKGRDAYQYLVFQRYIIYFLSLLSFVCIVIVLPVNIQGNFEGETKAFGKTTISNLDETSDLFWIHAVLAAIIMPIGVFMMNHFSKVIKTDEELITRRTLLIRRIPKFPNSKEILINYFQQNFADCPISGIQLVYDFVELEALELEFNNVLNAKAVCEHYNTQSASHMTIRPYCLGQLGCCCCCCCTKTDGFEYYSERQIKISDDIKKELVTTFSKPTGSVFVTFQTEKQAMEVYKYLKERQNTCLCCHCIIRGMVWITNVFHQKPIDSLELSRWQVSYAPYPDDINWKDLTVDYKWIWTRKLCIYLFLFVVFFFLSTPSILIKVMEFIANRESIKEGFFKPSSTFSDFLSPLLLMLMTIVLPVIVIFACERLPYKTISALNHAVMWKVYVFLVMMVIVLPSAGFLSTNALLENFFSTNSTKRFRWQCLFPVDNGAFFVNYALQAAFLGNTVEILRLPELFLYLFYYILSRSSAEYKNARKQVSFDFPFGVSYPRFLLIFAMAVTYSLACPLIAPCGLFYMICKHIVDRYNIYYIYTPTKINGRIHSTAVLYVHIALLMMQFQIFTFLLMRTKGSKVTAFSTIVLLIALLVFAGHCFYHWFKNINHLTYSVTTKLNKRSQKRDYCACAYTPPVFNDLLSDGLVRKAELISTNGPNS